MPRTRVHNLNISLDGYAAGEHVTFEEPIGGAERLFEWFDGRAIHGVDGVDDPWTLDRALTACGAKASAPRSWDGGSSARRSASGPTTAGADGGVTIPPFGHRCSS